MGIGALLTSAARTYGFGAPPPTQKPYTATAETEGWKLASRKITDGPKAKDWQITKVYKRELAETGLLDVPKAFSLYANNLVTLTKQVKGGDWSSVAQGNPVAGFFVKWLYSDQSPIAQLLSQHWSLQGIKLASDSIEAFNNALRIVPPSVSAAQSHSDLKRTDGIDVHELDGITRDHHDQSRTVLYARRAETAFTFAQRLTTIAAPFAFAAGLYDAYLASYMAGVSMLLASYGLAVYSVAPTTNAALIEHYFKDLMAYNIKPPLVMAHLIHQRFTHALALNLDVPELFQAKLVGQSLSREIKKLEETGETPKSGLRARLGRLVGPKSEPTKSLADTLKAHKSRLEELEVRYVERKMTASEFVETYKAAKRDLKAILNDSFLDDPAAQKVTRFLHNKKFLFATDLVRRLEMLIDATPSHENEELPAISEGAKKLLVQAVKDIDAVRHNGLTEEKIYTILDQLQVNLGDSKAVNTYIDEVKVDFAAALHIKDRAVDSAASQRFRIAFETRLATLQDLARQLRSDLEGPTRQIIGQHVDNTFIAGALRAVKDGAQTVRAKLGGHPPEHKEKMSDRDAMRIITDKRDEYFARSEQILRELSSLATQAEARVDKPKMEVRVELVEDTADEPSVASLITFGPTLGWQTEGDDILGRLHAMRQERKSEPSAITNIAGQREAENMIKFLTVGAFAVGGMMVFVDNNMALDFAKGLVGIAPENANHNDLALIVQGRLRGGYIFPLLFWVPMATASMWCSVNNYVRNRRRKSSPGKRRSDLTALFGTLFTTDSMAKPIGDTIMAGVRLFGSYFLSKETKSKA